MNKSILLVVSFFILFSSSLFADESLSLNINGDGFNDGYDILLADNEEFLKSNFDRKHYPASSVDGGAVAFKYIDIGSGVVVSYKGNDTFNIQYKSVNFVRWDDARYGNVETRLPVTDEVFFDKDFVVRRGESFVSSDSINKAVVSLDRK